MRDRAPLEVFLTFLKLGVTSFGGPISHLGYFREEIVMRRRWLDESAYGDIVALCQFLPGPGSSQVGFALGLVRAGYRGGVAAWLGFTLPSAILITLFAYEAPALRSTIGLGLLHGLKLAAVAVVARAVFGMARTLCPDWQRSGIAIAAAVIILLSASTLGQIGAVLIGGIAGLWLCRSTVPVAAGSIRVPVTRRAGIIALIIFIVLLAALPALAAWCPCIELCAALYRSGALVFGGGHVVLPLLSKAFVSPGWVSQDSFLAGYGATQALPGPLFTFAAYIGAVATIPPRGIAGAVLGLISIFLPGLLILIGTLPFWDALRTRVGAQAIMRGLNAAVVGLLAAALYSPLWTSTVSSLGDFAVALAGFVLLAVWRAPPLLVVIVSALGGVALSIAKIQ